jgi:integrase
MRDKLTDTSIRTVKPKAQPFKLSDGGGLHLLVSPNGSKLWRLRYRFDGKENMIGLGAYAPGSCDHVPLVIARRRRDEARRDLKDGKNPAAERKAARLPQAAQEPEGVTFESAARQWVAAHSQALSLKYAAVIERRLSRWLYPTLGDQNIATISGPDLLKVIKEIEKTGSIDLSRRMKIIAGQVFRFAVAHGWTERDVSNDIRDGLARQPRTKHRASLRPADLPEFFANLERYNAYRITKLATLFTLYTGARTGEVRFATWQEIEDLDGSAPLWRIPAPRMKMKKPHLVPLTPQTVAVLREARALYPNSAAIFPSEESRSGFLSENAMLYLLYRIGFYQRATVHGFRGLFSTVLNENGFNSDWIEVQLAHTEDDEVRAAYNAAQWLPQRRQMLEWWSDYLDQRALALGREQNTEA